MVGVSYDLTALGNSAYLGFERIEDVTSPMQVSYILAVAPLQYDYGGWHTAFAVQNLSTDSSAYVMVTCYDESGTVVECFGDPEHTIQPNGSIVFDSANASSLPASFRGSAWIESTEPVGVSSVSTYHPVLGLRSAHQGLGSAYAGSELLVPALFKNFAGQTSELCVQHLGPDSAEIYVEYSDGVSVQQTIPAGGLHCWFQGAEGHADGWAGGAMIWCPGEACHGVVTVLSYDGPTPVGIWSYGAVSFAQTMAPSSGQGLAYPFLLRDSDDWTSQIYLYNPGDAPVEVTPRFVSSYPLRYVFCEEAFTIPAGEFVWLSEAQMPSLFERGMAYFNANGQVFSAVGATSAKPLGTTDRHFGYRAAYPGAPAIFPDTCGLAEAVFLPLIVRNQ
jgi:hypothetical protein